MSTRFTDLQPWEVSAVEGQIFPYTPQKDRLLSISKSSHLCIQFVSTEERVVPIEVCRSKLSKYLQGVVFRCDKCTFTCSSDESLQQHIEKHNELKPYKCQLCYYETKHTEELDSHLRDEHKVGAWPPCSHPRHGVGRGRAESSYAALCRTDARAKIMFKVRFSLFHYQWTVRSF